jgi:hypothetical protein
MAKYRGNIGFETVKENPPKSGIWKPETIEKIYSGDVIRNVRRLDVGSQVNDNINVDNQISIIADAYAMQNYFSMRYAWWMNAKWRISSVSVEYPRLILTLGGIYHGK